MRDRNRRASSAVLLCMAVALMQLASGCGVGRSTTAPRGQDTLAKIQREGVLHVGYVVYPPTVIKDPNSGDLSGHFVDAVRFLADVMEVRVEFHEATFATFVAGLQNGQYDVSIAATYRTIPRAMSVAFTKPIIYIGNGAIVRRGESRFSALQDFDAPGIVLAVAQGEASHEYAREHFNKASIRALETADLSLPLSEVLSGRADVGLADAWTTSQFAKTHPEATDLFTGRPYDLTAVGWAARPDDMRWLNFLDTAIDYLESTGRMDQWEARYGAHWVKPVVEFMPH